MARKRLWTVALLLLAATPAFAANTFDIDSKTAPHAAGEGGGF